MTRPPAPARRADPAARARRAGRPAAITAPSAAQDGGDSAAATRPARGTGGAGAPVFQTLPYVPAAALLLLYLLFYLQFAAALISTPYGIDQGEGYDAWSAWLLAQGRWPYTDNAIHPYYSSNYPPVWSALAAIPMGWTGPALAPARAVATVATLAAAGLLAAAAFRLTRDLGSRWARGLAGVLAATLFLASPYVFHTTPLARVNSLCLMFGLAALSLFEAPTRTRVGIGSVLLVIGLFTKPSALDATVAAIGFALLTAPAQARAAIAIVGGGGTALLLALIAATQGSFWLNVVLANSNPFDVGQLVKYLANFSVLHLAIIALATSEWRSALRRGARSPWILYLPIALAGALLVGKWGAGESYFLGGLAALSLFAAMRTARIVAGPSSRVPASSRRRLILAGALLAQLLMLAHGPLSEVASWLPDRGPQAAYLGRPLRTDETSSLADLVALARSTSAPILTEEPSIAIAAGKPIIGNATQLHHLFDQGRWDPTHLVAEIEARRFGLVVLNAQLYPPPVLAAIGRRYALSHTLTVAGSTYWVFVPGHD